jgi:hypothetical protein
MNVAAVLWLLAALTCDCIGAHAGNMTPFRSLPLKCSRCVILVFTEIALRFRLMARGIGDGRCVAFADH